MNARTISRSSIGADDRRFLCMHQVLCARRARKSQPQRCIRGTKRLRLRTFSRDATDREAGAVRLFFILIGFEPGKSIAQVSARRRFAAVKNEREPSRRTCCVVMKAALPDTGFEAHFIDARLRLFGDLKCGGPDHEKPLVFNLMNFPVLRPDVFRA